MKIPIYESYIRGSRIAPQLDDGDWLSNRGHWPHFTVQPLAKMIFGNVEIVLGLEPQPKLGGVAKEACQAKGCVCGDTALAEHDFIDTPCIHTDINCKAILTQVHRFDEFLEKYFAWMDGGKLVTHCCSF
jgi:hypothetical protein